MKGARSPPDGIPRLARRHPPIVQHLWAFLGWGGRDGVGSRVVGGRGGLNK